MNEDKKQRNSEQRALRPGSGASDAGRLAVSSEWQSFAVKEFTILNSEGDGHPESPLPLKTLWEEYDLSLFYNNRARKYTGSSYTGRGLSETPFHSKEVEQGALRRSLGGGHRSVERGAGTLVDRKACPCFMLKTLPVDLGRCVGLGNPAQTVPVRRSAFIRGFGATPPQCTSASPCRWAASPAPCPTGRTPRRSPRG